ncbi:MAG TPA: RNA polymerase sporulation sigma factor SigK [Clostridiales bacterium]|nr:RNA polymerase sporulation sigma factor SigK [Clostridiales bacterium]
MFTYFFSVLSHLFNLILGIGNAQSFPPPLSPEEESEYFSRMKNGDEEARQRLILHNLRLVAHIIRKYYSGSKCQDDLISVGSIGLVKAVDSYNQNKTTKFATYAAKCIQNEVLMFFRSQKKLANEVSINETIDIDRDGNPLTYIDVISCDDTVAEDVDRKMQTDRMYYFINNVLSEREKQIIIMRYGLYGSRQFTQREVALAMGISRSYVSRIEKSALDKLFEAFDGKNEK